MFNSDDCILITGGAGFIGSNFITYLLDKYKNIKVINLDKLSYAGSLSNLKEIEQNPNYIFIRGDICNKELLNSIFLNYDIRGVIHFAAESHVDKSIKNPDSFMKSNIMGTFTLLEIAKEHWMESPFSYKRDYQDCRFHHISTDEVYGSLEDSGYFTEETSYAPNNPYSASKASSDMIVRSYFHTYGLNTVTTHCSNNYGPKQHIEKLIPTVIHKALKLESIPVYGDGKNIRDWLYVDDHCTGIELAFRHGKAGETYNIGGNNERDNIYIVNMICEILDELSPETKAQKSINSYKDLIKFVDDRPGHDRRYAIDSTKIRLQLGWEPVESLESGLYKTIKWYINEFNHKNSLEIKR